MENQDKVKRPRPDSITFVCVINFILCILFSMILGILLFNTDWTGNTNNMSILLYFIMDIAFITPVVYIWKMKRWGAYLYVAITMVLFIVLCLYSKGLGTRIYFSIVVHIFLIEIIITAAF